MFSRFVSCFALTVLNAVHTIQFCNISKNILMLFINSFYIIAMTKTRYIEVQSEGF